MLFDSRSTQAAQASLDNLWLKTQVISNNMANVDTPGFKASNVTFGEVLEGAARKIGGKKAPTNQGQPESKRSATFRTRVEQDEASSVRIDGNNVVLEREQAELWKTYAQYSYLLDSVSGHYRNINTAISSMRG